MMRKDIMSTLRHKLGLDTDWFVGPRIELKPFNFGLIINRPSHSPYQHDIEFPIYDISDATRLVQVLVTMMNKQFGLTVESLHDGTVKFNTPSPGPYPQKFDVMNAMNHNSQNKGEKEQETNTKEEQKEQYQSIIKDLVNKVNKLENELNTIKTKKKYIEWPGQDD